MAQDSPEDSASPHRLPTGLGRCSPCQTTGDGVKTPRGTLAANVPTGCRSGPPVGPQTEAGVGEPDRDQLRQPRGKFTR
ncbi:hypothetical protein chiPu_0027136 [Chiloscyllium punctatum]|uniref:Uncharacterized protein n=1 Tax=Chiloscyllium punctatum TaxID=137246 RepID=A0A401TKI5_CHIPU|nr:hypothetical protein [Chiloscyllium punctatum]